MVLIAIEVLVNNYNFNIIIIVIVYMEFISNIVTSSRQGKTQLNVGVSTSQRWQNNYTIKKLNCIN